MDDQIKQLQDIRISLGWSIKTLADKAQLSKSAILRMEEGASLGNSAIWSIIDAMKREIKSRGYPVTKKHLSEEDKIDLKIYFPNMSRSEIKRLFSGEWLQKNVKRSSAARFNSIDEAIDDLKNQISNIQPDNLKNKISTKYENIFNNQKSRRTEPDDSHGKASSYSKELINSLSDVQRQKYYEEFDEYINAPSGSPQKCIKGFRHAILNERTLGGKYKAFQEGPLEPEYILRHAMVCDPADQRQLATTLCPLFFCFRTPSSNDLYCMRIMLEAIQAGVLQYRVEFIDTAPEIDEHLENTGPDRGRTVESAEHKGMKHWVSQHLESRGLHAVAEEVSYLGYEVDVGCLTERVFVECGDTEPQKIFDFLRSGEDVGILQYDAENIVWFISSRIFIAVAEEESKKIISIRNSSLYKT